MAVSDVLESRYYGAPGFLYPYDMRHSAADRAFCNPLPDGRVQFRLVTQHGFAEATLVYNDGTAQGAPLELYARDSRFLYWETLIRPANALVTYSFALKTAAGQTVYFCKHGVDHAVEPLDRWVLDLSAVRPFEVPGWMNGAVVYQIFPDRFANGDRSNDPAGTVPWGSPPAWLEFQGGDLQGISAALDYLQALGVDVLYLTPIFVSPSTHKYDTEDFYHVDPGFGGDQALHDLVAALHGRGMRLILDASFNHCNPRFFAFQDVLKNGADSAYRDWFTIHEYPVNIRYRPHLLQEARRRQYEHWVESLPRVSGIPFEQVEDEGALFEPSYLAWYGVLDMPKLNQRHPATRAYFLDVAAYWLREFDIDGWRMDVARHVEPDFWVDFRRVCKAAKPDCYLLAEIWGNTAPWLQGDQFDATMNYIFRDLSVAYFARAEMDTATFLDGITRMFAVYAPQVANVNYNLLSSHDVERFRQAAGERPERLALATLLQMTLPGAAAVYYGDEIGLTGGDDPDCRRAFPWDRPDSWEKSILQTVRKLAALRHAHPALRYGEWRLLWTGLEAFAFERVYAGQSVLVVINRGEALDVVRMPVVSAAPVLLWGATRLTPVSNGVVLESLPAWSGAVIAL